MPLMRPANGDEPSVFTLSEPTLTLHPNADGLFDVPENCVPRMWQLGWIVAAAKPTTTTAALHEVHPGAIADQLIAAEVAKQDQTWGEANERNDASKGQILGAAVAQTSAIFVVNAAPEVSRERAFAEAEIAFYPKDWSGFRDYGSDVANLVVAAAYLRNEIKRRIRNGESTYRAPRHSYGV